ncbi:YciI family protein [Clostridium sp. BL-8]|uniref:YciI family protein n=1 Tax=Clostridium sp. BL-8 TaxID=349938 RepID=UPI00098BD7B7|nr:YciI family protein [Clostridium sp. BL-8]OOM80203.1 YciI-like protein [Clostridium sp. BL-8]
MKKGDKLFVRIDYKNEELETTEKDFQDHVEYLKGVAAERYFVGGGFSNARGGMIIFEAKDLEEAKNIAKKDPIIERGLFRVKVYEWDLLILSDN